MALRTLGQAVSNLSLIIERETMDAVFGQEDMSNSLAVSRKFLQPIWDLRLGYEEYVRSPLFSIFMSISFYFFTMIPCMLLDLVFYDWKIVQKYKMQPQKPPTWPEIKNAIKLTLRNQMLFIAPLTVVQYIWESPSPLPPEAPDLFTFMWQISAMIIVFDTEYFVWHITHHKVRFLYRHVHAIHHEYHSPHSCVTQYVHPWELITVGIYTATTQWLFDAHLMTALGFQLWSITISVEAHAGYDFPWMMHNWFPFGLWGGAPKHDMHHQRPRTNFQPFLTYWDKLLGTECPGVRAGGYRPPELEAYDAKRKQDKLKMKYL